MSTDYSFIDSYNTVLNNAYEKLTSYFKTFGGLETKDTFGNAAKGLRRIGSEHILKSELYHHFRNILPNDYVTAVEFKPFANKKEYYSFYEENPRKEFSHLRNPSIDLAIFKTIEDVKDNIPESWIELKITGQIFSCLGVLLSDLYKLYSIAYVFHKKGEDNHIPKAMISFVFNESPPPESELKTHFTDMVSLSIIEDLVNSDTTMKDKLKNNLKKSLDQFYHIEDIDFFGKKFFGTILWRSDYNWKMLPVNLERK